MKIDKLKVGKAIFGGDIKSGAEGSIIVPDVKPDILKVLQADADCVLTEKSIDDGKLVLKGNLIVNVLYVPESENDNIQCLKGCFEFCETCKNPEFSADMQVVAYADVQKVGYKLINSRKIGIEAEICISTEVMGNEKIDILCDVEDEYAEIKKECICVNSGEAYREFAFSLEETLDFPETKARIAEILRSNVTIFDKEYKTISGKLVVKGKANLSLLYSSCDGTCEHIDYELPFTEVFDFEELGEDCECDIIFIPEGNEVVLSANEAERQTLGIHSMVRACVRVEKCEEKEVVTDCYFTDHLADIEYCDIMTEHTVGKPFASYMIKEILEKGEGQPDISGIYTAVAKPVITSSQISGGRIAVSGKMTVYVLYTSKSVQNPVCAINEELPFSYMVDCDSVSRGDDVLLMAECEHISCTISSPSSVEIRCGLVIKGRVVKKCKVKAVCSAEIKDRCDKESAMVVYFVKDGDNIWDIGKNYHVKCKKITEANNLEENAELSAGDKLIIPMC